MTQLRTIMLEELQRRNFSQTTVKTYLKIVEDFACHFHRPPDQLGKEHIRTYQVYLLQERKLGVRTVALHTAALRFFFCKTLKRAYPVEEVPYPRAPRRLPIILTREEAVRLIDSASNLFHRAMLITMYSTGMRRADLCRLKVEDIDSTRMLIRKRFDAYWERKADTNSRALQSAGPIEAPHITGGTSAAMPMPYDPRFIKKMTRPLNTPTPRRAPVPE